MPSRPSNPRVDAIALKEAARTKRQRRQPLQPPEDSGRITAFFVAHPHPLSRNRFLCRATESLARLFRSAGLDGRGIV